MVRRQRLQWLEEIQRNSRMVPHPACSDGLGIFFGLYWMAIESSRGKQVICSAYENHPSGNIIIYFLYL